ncbi:MAG TPA: tetratricopeptide repeat protein [Burkholderiales bacterium]|nr:tetratricopeptide repeat protein [Burkholderiales bacterium]
MRAAAIALSLALVAAIAARAVIAAEDSLADLERATRVNPGSASAWDRLGEMFARVQRFGEAQEAFAKGLKLAPNSKALLQHLALMHAWSGNYKEAERRYTDLLGGYPRDTALRLDYGQTLAWDGRFEEAREQYGIVLTESPRHVEALRLLAQLTAWQGNYDGALDLLDRALAVDPQNTNVLVSLGEILSWKGDLSRSIRAFRQALDIAPRNASVWADIGQAYAWQGRTREALDAYSAAIAIDPRMVEAYLGLARVYKDNHQYGEAEKRLRAALALFPSDSRLSKELAALAADKSLRLSDVMGWLPPILFVVILLTIHRHVWRYRRVLRPRRVVTGILLASLPVLALLTASVYGFVLFGGAYYKAAEYASRLLQVVNLIMLVAVFFSLVWLLRFQRPWREHVVLAVGAHPDDIEFGCGAALLRYREEGCKTYGLVLSAGEQGGGEPSERIEEARRSARVIALTEITVLDFPDTRLHTRKEEIRGAIEEKISQLRPDIVFTHTALDVHTDHKTTFDATREAARGACTILCYENPNTPPEFNPDYYVDIGDYLEDKIAALSLHKSQTGKDYNNAAVVRASASFRGNQAHVRFAEAFESVRVLEKAAPV